MEDKTIAVIMICKSNVSDAAAEKIKALNLDTIETLRLWLSKYSGTALKYISDNDVQQLVRDAVVDYICSCGNPRPFLDRILRFKDRGYDEMQAFITAFRLLEIRESRLVYINGFKEEDITPIDF